MANPSDDVKNRFAERFQNDEKSEQEQTEQRSKTVKKDKPDQTVKSSASEQTDKKANIKQEWTNHSVYLPDELTDSLGRRYKYLDLDLDEEFDLSIQKTRHYYPLIVKLGLERLDELSSKETKDKLAELEGSDT